MSNMGHGESSCFLYRILATESTVSDVPSPRLVLWAFSPRDCGYITQVSQHLGNIPTVAVVHSFNRPLWTLEVLPALDFTVLKEPSREM